jgi:hypothetical protein
MLRRPDAKSIMPVTRAAAVLVFQQPSLSWFMIMGFLVLIEAFLIEKNGIASRRAMVNTMYGSTVEYSGFF